MFEPLMTLYLTDNTSAEEIKRAKASGIVHGVKLYPAGATTNSDSGVTSLDKCAPALEAMQAVGMPLLTHGEVTDANVDVFDREKVFIERHMQPLLKRYPNLKVVFEHITHPRRRRVCRTSRQKHCRHHHRAPFTHEPQRHVHGRHPPTPLLPARAQTRDASTRPHQSRHLRLTQILFRH